ncbi:MAG: ribulose 1,5-bisphosphate carboxylase large subunit [Chloroflexi bacterium]|nr:ribulose 1,5-bisphosphate carboxylase large subunit [Chloroflexota bacterium]
MVFPETSLDLTGERFTVYYRLVAEDQQEARARAYGICLEQTVEVSAELLADDAIRAQVVGRIEHMAEIAPNRYEVAISYAVETTAFEFTQYLNVIFGNTAMQRGIRVLRLALPNSLLRHFKGPRFGQSGIRHLLDVFDRPLICTALKPMGLAANDLAELAYQMALGGIDIIKEDHGLTDQPFAPFTDRVGRCAEAIQRANRQSGYRCLYIPNITGPADKIVGRAYEAKRLGAGGLMIAPGLVGWDTLRMLANDDVLALPILCHPAWLGTYVLHPHQGVSHHVMFGQLPRLAGADATIFVNYGGRFPFTQDDCRDIERAVTMPLGELKQIFPIPSGGMDLARLRDMHEFYGTDVIFLIAGGLYAHGPDLLENARYFRKEVDSL